MPIRALAPSAKGTFRPRRKGFEGSGFRMERPAPEDLEGEHWRLGHSEHGVLLLVIEPELIQYVIDPRSW
jgi:hypothetical protein